MNARELSTRVTALNLGFNNLTLDVSYCDVSYLNALKAILNPVKYVGFSQTQSSGRISVVVCRDSGSYLPVLAGTMYITPELYSHVHAPVDFVLEKLAEIKINQWVYSGTAFTTVEAKVHAQMERLATIAFARTSKRR